MTIRHTTARPPRRLATRLAALTLISGALLSVGCEHEFNETWNQPLDIAGPFVTNGDLLYINRTLGEVLRLDATKEGDKLGLEIDRVPTGERPGSVATSADGSTLFVVNKDDETLTIVDLTAEELEAKTLELNSAYDVLTVDPRGDFLLLSFSGITEEGVIARNLNQLGIVDLRGGEPEAKFVTLASRARELIFADPFELGGEEQRLVASLSTSQVTIIDLLADQDDPENLLREVPLTLSEADTPRTPIQAIFDVTPSEDLPDTINLYLLTANSNDITQIAVRPSVREDSIFKFNLSVNQLAAGTNPGAMTLLEMPGRGTRLLTTNQRSPQFTIIDVSSGHGATFALPMDAPADSIKTYTATQASGGELVEELRVLAYTSSSTIVSVIRPETIAISADQPTLGRSVEAIRLERAPQRIELDEAAAKERAVVFHSGLTGGFTVLDLRDNRDIPIQGYSLTDIFFDGQLAFGVFSGTQHMGVFDLETGQPTVFDLPLLGESIAVDDKDGLLVVQHEGATGVFTILDATEPTPENAIILRDVFLQDVLDKELPDAN